MVKTALGKAYDNQPLQLWLRFDGNNYFESSQNVHCWYYMKTTNDKGYTKWDVESRDIFTTALPNNGEISLSGLSFIPPF